MIGHVSYATKNCWAASQQYFAVLRSEQEEDHDAVKTATAGLLDVTALFAFVIIRIKMGTGLWPLSALLTSVGEVTYLALCW